MRVRAAEAGCTRITCALDDENEEKYSFTVNVKLIEVKPVETRPEIKGWTLRVGLANRLLQKWES